MCAFQTGIDQLRHDVTSFEICVLTLSFFSDHPVSHLSPVLTPIVGGTSEARRIAYEKEGKDPQ